MGSKIVMSSWRLQKHETSTTQKLWLRQELKKCYSLSVHLFVRSESTQRASESTHRALREQQESTQRAISEHLVCTQWALRASKSESIQLEPINTASCYFKQLVSFSNYERRILTWMQGCWGSKNKIQEEEIIFGTPWILCSNHQILIFLFLYLKLPDSLL